MKPSFLVKAFPSFILVFHQKAIFFYRNGELGSTVVLTQSKQGPAIAPPHSNTNQGAQTTSVGPCAGEVPMLSVFQPLALRRGGGGGTACVWQHPAAPPSAVVPRVGQHRVPSLGQQQLPPSPLPTAETNHKWSFGG